jgi:hypothetical protein
VFLSYAFSMATKKRPTRSKLKASEISALYAQLALERPDPRTELDYRDAYTLVVAVALSAQSTDVGVNKATKGLFKAADTPEKMVALGVEGVEKHIKTIGLWRNKAKNVVALSQMLLDQYDGVVPRDRDALTLFRASDAKRQMWSLMKPLANQPLPWTPIFFASQTELALRRAKHPMPLKRFWSG